MLLYILFSAYNAIYIDVSAKGEGEGLIGRKGEESGRLRSTKEERV